MGKGKQVASKKKGLKVWQLILALIVVVCGTLLFVAAAGGWFSQTKMSLDKEYYCGGACSDGFMELTPDEYEKLIGNRKSFIVLIDQNGCTTADRLRGFVRNYALETGIKVYRMMFSEMKGTTLHEKVKYYPSVVLVNKGNIVNFLRADSDEDADIYNNYDRFKGWMTQYL